MQSDTHCQLFIVPEIWSSHGCPRGSPLQILKQHSPRWCRPGAPAGGRKKRQWERTQKMTGIQKQHQVQATATYFREEFKWVGVDDASVGEHRWCWWSHLSPCSHGLHDAVVGVEEHLSAEASQLEAEVDVRVQSRGAVPQPQQLIVPLHLLGRTLPGEVCAFVVVVVALRKTIETPQPIRSFLAPQFQRFLHELPPCFLKPHPGFGLYLLGVPVRMPGPHQCSWRLPVHLLVIPVPLPYRSPALPVHHSQALEIPVGDEFADIIRGFSEVLIQTCVLWDSAINRHSQGGVPGIQTELISIEDGYVFSHKGLVLVLGDVEGLQVEVHAILGEAGSCRDIPHSEERHLGERWCFHLQPWNKAD